jgi:hypothetical protein
MKNDRMITGNDLEKVWEKVTLICLKNLFHHLSGGLRKNGKTSVKIVNLLVKNQNRNILNKQRKDYGLLGNHKM